MKLLVAAALLLASPGALACSSALPLKGSVFVESCDPRDSTCRDATKQLYAYLQSTVDRPAVLSIAVQTSPWHIYGPDMRIMTMDDLVARIRPLLKSPV
ncbi:MAG TPA: hypothetical protein VK753_07460, partial [Xanthomonadaceae bacterium]|nr:hypothetical protein [Xanthomonadaceae bacterium]